mmetsp:Transcript_21123/g.65177  ORF Transcript_21123/g.65177 Transcript_21123/m.65177 type:complete len:276 (-) Transcript_21123:19-846(-)
MRWTTSYRTLSMPSGAGGAFAMVAYHSARPRPTLSSALSTGDDATVNVSSSFAYFCHSGSFPQNARSAASSATHGNLEISSAKVDNKRSRVFVKALSSEPLAVTLITLGGMGGTRRPAYRFANASRSVANSENRRAPCNSVCLPSMSMRVVMWYTTCRDSVEPTVSAFSTLTVNEGNDERATRHASSHGGAGVAIARVGGSSVFCGVRGSSSAVFSSTTGCADSRAGSTGFSADSSVAAAGGVSSAGGGVVASSSGFSVVASGFASGSSSAIFML